MKIKQVQSKTFDGAQLQAKEPAQQVLIDRDVIAHDLAVEPGTPVTLAVKERIEGFVGSFGDFSAGRFGVRYIGAAHSHAKQRVSAGH